MADNPLVLGPPIGVGDDSSHSDNRTAPSVTSTTGNLPTQPPPPATSTQAESIPHTTLATIPEPRTFSPSAGTASGSQRDGQPLQTAASHPAPAPASPPPPPPPPSTSTSTRTALPPTPPHLNHTRTAPTTFPTRGVAHLPLTNPHQLSSSSGSGNTPSSRDSDEESSTPTLNGTQVGGGVPREVGGLHGQPMPGSKMGGHEVIDEKDRQSGTTGGKTGGSLAERAVADLGLNEKTGGGGLGAVTATPGAVMGRARRSSTLKSDKRYSPFTKLDRTLSGTQVARQHYKAGGVEPVSGFGMTPISRQPSLPPAVAPWGGVAPTGPDAEEGLWAVRSHQEEVDRQKELDKKGPDPFAVRFEPGDKENPKVGQGVDFTSWACSFFAMMLGWAVLGLHLRQT
jgi:hypothetical protein